MFLSAHKNIPPPPSLPSKRIICAQLETKTGSRMTKRSLVREIVVTHHDQLCRFTYEFLKYVFLLNSKKLMVLFDDLVTDKHELSKDIFAINTTFICRFIESLNSLISKFALEYSNRVRELVQQTEVSSYPPTFNSQQLEELKLYLHAKLFWDPEIAILGKKVEIFKFIRAKARNICVEKAIKIKNETINEIVNREIAKSEQDPEHESFYTIHLNRVKDCLDQIEHHK
ncbi:hypothetical protein Glove_269g11 [Diversispora epigaea]|uniref:Uncharacterized protein n=1 Tax=Diversispora epigaea TaxID=1348612 RepID=A0A397ICS2_9GLOM|nr:hypothetical protein Glove_269g11 [Diversispora epigaea]